MGVIAPTTGDGDWTCFYCGGLAPDHFVEEWDGCLHRGCVAAFLQTTEGMVVNEHKHEITLMTPEGVFMTLLHEGEAREALPILRHRDDWTWEG